MSEINPNDESKWLSLDDRMCQIERAAHFLNLAIHIHKNFPPANYLEEFSEHLSECAVGFAIEKLFLQAKDEMNENPDHHLVIQ